MAASRRMLLALALTGAAWGVHLFGRALPTWGAVLVWAALTWPIAVGLAQRGRIRCGAFRAAYLKPGGWLARRVGRRAPIALRAAVVAALVASVLLAAVVRLDEAAAWIVLVIGAPATVLVYGLASRMLAAQVSPRYLPELAWRLTSAVAGLVLVAALVALAYHRPYPDLSDVGLDRAVWHFVDQERARSTLIEIPLQMAAVKDGLRLWLAQQLMPEPGLSVAQALGWLVVLAEEAVFVWSYLLYLCPVLVGFTDDEPIDNA